MLPALGPEHAHWLWPVYRIARLVTHPSAWTIVAVAISLVMLAARRRRYR